MDEIKRILVLCRLSQYCKEAVQIGISLAKNYQADLTVLHLISNPVDQEALNVPLPYPDESHKSYLSLQEEAKEELDRLLKSEMASGMPIKLLIKDGAPADEIAAVVKEEKIDLLVMLAQEEGRLEHVLFGGESEEIIRRMPCHIFIVKREPDQVDW